MRLRAVLPPILLAATAAAAAAYHGGPEYVEVLGWDPAERRVYCAIHDLSEAVYPDGLVYFSLDSLHASRPTRVGWSRQDGLPDSVRQARWNRVVERLRPLVLVAGPAMPRGSRVLVADSVATPDEGKVPRFRVRVGSAGDVGAPSLEVITYYEPTVTFPRVYQVPGRAERLVVLSFIGQTYGAEEVQVPVLLRGRSTPPIVVDWQPWHPE